jgi:hypothetical protein
VIFEGPTPIAAGINWLEALRSAALGGILLAIALTLPMASPLLLMLAAGGLTVVLYLKRSPAPITRGLGARVGAIGGLLAWVILAIFFSLELAAGGGRLMAVLREAIRDQIASNSDPRAQQVLETFNSPGGMATVVLFGMLLFLVVVLLCGAAGGAITASLFARIQEKNKPQGRP